MNDEPRKEAEALHSALLTKAGFAHAFFTRRGGVSVPPWDTLNLAASTGDDPAAVRENLARVARHLGVPAEKVYFLSQVHGVDARVLTGDEARDEVLTERGDITLSATSGVACGIRTADCIPVLLADRNSGAVAAVHSGWRGTVAGAAAAGLLALRRLADPGARYIAAIGPHIEACCFEVGEDVAEQLAACSSLGAAAVLPREGAPPHVDLRRVVRAQLEAAGLDPEAIDDVPGCTVCDAARFFSFRRDGQRSGRLFSAIVARA
ncbi:peptidoglycan editing factor PgeF [Chondromyces crocatus]|uniref:Purine nucleoside phosphorylase n=1 Tax=Chondromyces crocatus TaxID=52 RepID=A0A0K1E969_CHOCO|nr:peptidoglycan editing factor PgeF [Chondromyces crocatus]AKT37222.1 laccase [Chondromyces crocatus]